jgi:hypothetical protein
MGRDFRGKPGRVKGDSKNEAVKINLRLHFKSIYPKTYPTGIGFRYFTVTDSEQVLFFFIRELIGNK